MRIDFQISVAGTVEVGDSAGTMEASARLAGFQRSMQYSAQASYVHIDGITLGWKERPLSPMEQLQKLESDKLYNPAKHGTADSPAAPSGDIPAE